MGSRELTRNPVVTGVPAERAADLASYDAYLTLETLPRRDLTQGELEELVAGLANRPEEWGHHVAFDSEERVYASLHRDLGAYQRDATMNRDYGRIVRARSDEDVRREHLLVQHEAKQVHQQTRFFLRHSDEPAAVGLQDVVGVGEFQQPDVLAHQIGRFREHELPLRNQMAMRHGKKQDMRQRFVQKKPAMQVPWTEPLFGRKSIEIIRLRFLPRTCNKRPRH